MGTELPSFPPFPIFFAAYHHRLRRPSHTFSRKRLSRPHSLIAWRDNAVISPENYSLSLSFSPHPTSLHACMHGYMHSLDTLSDLSYVADEYD